MDLWSRCRENEKSGCEGVEVCHTAESVWRCCVEEVVEEVWRMSVIVTVVCDVRKKK